MHIWKKFAFEIFLDILILKNPSNHVNHIKTYVEG